MWDNPDYVNAAFEFFGGCTIWLNVRRLYKDKRIAGVVWWFQLFFIAWGSYNLRYYTYYHSDASFYAGAWMLFANVVWVTLAVYYLKVANHEAEHTFPN